MPIRHSLLLLIFFLLFFAPGLENWMRSGATEWYRPFIVWAIVIAVVALGQKLSNSLDA